MNAPAPKPRAFLLAGGQSSRMGRDKAQLAFRGRSLLEHALLKLLEAGFAPQIAGLRAGTHPYLPDNFPDAGPLGGIEAALSSLGEEPPQPVLFFPVDLPLLPPVFVRTLFTRAGVSGALATIAFAGGRPQPLCAVYHSSLAPGLRAALASGDRKVMRVMHALAGSALDCPRVEALAPLHGWQAHRWFTNLNTPEDYQRLQVTGFQLS